MKNQITAKLLILFIVSLTSCGNGSVKGTKGSFIDSTLKKKLSIIDSIPTLDTTIVLKKYTPAKYAGKILSTSIAKNILYNHFRSKGYLIQEELKGISETDELKTCVTYDTIYKVNNKTSSAVISYWLAPPYSSGHCYQPSKAIIVDTDKGYKITNEEFIPTSFTIDSISMIDCYPIIFCYDFDCGEDKVIKKIRIKLK